MTEPQANAPDLTAQVLREYLDEVDRVVGSIPPAEIERRLGEIYRRAGIQPGVTVEETPEGDPGTEAVQAWFRDGGC
jgi:hypothetical protein